MIEASRSCEGKYQFESRADAKRARRAVYGRRQGSKNGPLSIYRCQTCDYLHLGHLPAAVRSGDRDKDDYTGVTHVRD